MPIPSSINDLDEVANNNSPAGSNPIGSSLDDYLRAHAAIIKQVDNSKPSYSSLAASSGSSIVGYMSSGGGAVATTVQTKLRETVSVKDYGAVGDGVTDDTQKFTLLEAAHSGAVVNLGGKSYAVSSYPVGNTYINGTFVIGGDTYDAAQDKAVISSLTDTGGIDTAYSGGVIPLPTVSGRTTPHLFGLFASQNCRSEGVPRAVNIGSIYSHAKGNVSGNYSARQSLAWAPQSVNIASEECWVWGGFRGANLASIYSGCEHESNANVASRYSVASGRNSSNISSTVSYAGRGGGARFTVTTAAGGVSSIAINAGGAGYQVGDALVFSDRAGAGTGAAATVATVNGSGSILTLSAITPGSGYSSIVDATVDNGTGDYAANVASSTCTASGESSANIASYNQTTSGLRSISVASQNGTTSGANAAQIASNAGTASGSQSAVIASNGSVASGVGSLVLGGNQSAADLDGALVIGRRVKPRAIRTLTYGDSSSGSAATANIKVEFSTNGNIAAAGTFTGSTVFTDYAEYFENLDLGVIPLGTLVTLVGRKVRPAQPGDDILGVVSATALVVAGDSPFTWAKRYLTGEFGEPLCDEIPDPDWPALIPNPEWVRGPGETSSSEDAPLIPNPEPNPMVRIQRENPDYDPAIQNVPRSDRPEEWSCVGLLGQVHVRVDDTVSAGQYVAAYEAGVGTRSDDDTRIKCMEIRKQFDPNKGYAVALCLIR